jgi:hypothetical protein
MTNAHEFSEAALNQKVDEDELKEEEDIGKLEVKREEMEIKVSIIIIIIFIIVIIRLTLIDENKKEKDDLRRKIVMYYIKQMKA